MRGFAHCSFLSEASLKKSPKLSLSNICFSHYGSIFFKAICFMGFYLASSNSTCLTFIFTAFENVITRFSCSRSFSAFYGYCCSLFCASPIKRTRSSCELIEEFHVVSCFRGSRDCRPKCLLSCSIFQWSVSSQAASHPWALTLSSFNESLEHDFRLILAQSLIPSLKLFKQLLLLLFLLLFFWLKQRVRRWNKQRKKATNAEE